MFKVRVAMPFGKYKGEPVEDIPTGYIEWALSEVNLPPEVQDEMEKQLALRRGEGVVRGKLEQ